MFLRQCDFIFGLSFSETDTDDYVLREANEISSCSTGYETGLPNSFSFL